MALAAALVAPDAHADAIRYRYVDLSQVALPAPYAIFSPSTVIDGRVVGTVFDAAFTVEAIAVYRDGAITVGPAGSASVANDRGEVGGANMVGQAALFMRGNTTLVPQLPNEAFANVAGLSRDGLALVSSTDIFGNLSLAYFRNGTETVINFNLPDPMFNGFMNDFGQVSATKQESPTDHFWHGYRYDPWSQQTTLLPPFAGDATDTMVLVQGIHDDGEVLGYSFVQFGVSPYHERVGVWDRSAVFHPFFEETINTNLLVFNDADQIVISNTSDGNSYLVPFPGTRLNLADITVNVPAGVQLSTSVGIDNRGNIAGLAFDANFNAYPFLLAPMRDSDGYPGDGHAGGCPIPWGIARGWDAKRAHK
jgi:hypothetical protein